MFIMWLKAGNTVGIHQCVHLDTCLAHGAVVADGALIVAQKRTAENGGHREALTFVHAGEDGADTHRNAAVVIDGFDTGLGGIAGGQAGGENQNTLAHDHRGGIVAEKKLTADSMLRRGNINCLMGVHSVEAGLRQLACHAGTDHLGTVKAQDSVDNCTALELGGQLNGRFPRLTEAVLCKGQVNVIVDMAVVRSEMPLCNTEGNAAAAGRFYLKQVDCHVIQSFL